MIGMDFPLKFMGYQVAALILVSCQATAAAGDRSWAEQLRDIEPGVQNIKDVVQRGWARHGTFERLGLFGDRFGSRLTGSQALEDSIDYVLKNFTEEGFHIRTENVTVPQWTRGEESAELILLQNNARLPLSILGIGLSVGTGARPIVADVIAVTSFDELQGKGDEVRGKIVVFNQPWSNYSVSKVYRTQGAARASNLGAVGVLVRSITQLSVYSPHTGALTYGNSTTIPAACLTVEDAEMIHRRYLRGESMQIRLTMGAHMNQPTTSRNVVAELPGSLHPNQLVVFGAHIDSWDVGTGAMDDGAGCMLAWQALSIIKRLKLQTKRTLRLVFWTSEEQGLIGGQEYYRRHIQEDKDRVSLIMESDRGTFKPRGLKFTGSPRAREAVSRILDLMSDIAVNEMTTEGSSSDTKWWVNDGVPGAELYNLNDNYHIYHHSRGDTISVLDADDLDLCTILWTSVIYAVSNLDEMLPRDMKSAGINTTTSWLSTASLVSTVFFLLRL